MATIKQYKNAAGKTLYEVFVYAGRDELTNKKKWIHKRGFTAKKQATLAASRLTLDADKHDLTKRKNLHFKEVYEEWYETYIHTVRESTYNYVRNNFDNHILPLFAKKRIGDITTVQLQKAVNQWAKEATRNYARWFRFAARVLRYAKKQGYITSNPADGVVIPKRMPTPGDEPENFWDKQQLAAFFSYINQTTEPEKYTLFRVLAFGGLRRGECLALTWADINFTAGTIRVNKTLTQGEKGRQIVQAPKTRKGRRTVPMDPKSMKWLKHWRIMQMAEYMARGINTHKPDQLVFATRTNRHKYLNQPEKWLKSIETKDSKQDKPLLAHTITIHGFRHSHASACFASGMTIKEVQARLGHENAQTTLNIYTHVTPEQGEKAAEKVAGYLAF